LQARTGVDIIYFVTHDYWRWYDGFLDALEQGADRRMDVRDGAVTIYVYTYGQSIRSDVDAR
jgi:hypothetical protein